MHVTIEAAEAAIQAARKRAVELGTEMCIAIVNSGANLKAFYRMDAAWVGRSVSTILRQPVLEFRLGFLRVEMAG